MLIQLYQVDDAQQHGWGHIYALTKAADSRACLNRGPFILLRRRGWLDDLRDGRRLWTAPPRQKGTKCVRQMLMMVSSAVIHSERRILLGLGKSATHSMINTLFYGFSYIMLLCSNLPNVTPRGCSCTRCQPHAAFHIRSERRASAAS